MGKKKRPKRKRRSRRRRRRRPRQSKKATYPSPAERERIIERRDALLEKLIFALVLDSEDERNHNIDQLIREHGLREVELLLGAFQRSTTSRELIAEEVLIYREYRRAFARFGGERRFLGKKEHEDLIFENGKLMAKRKVQSITPSDPSPREQELRHLLLIGVDYWEDITPPATPPRPADFEAPPPGRYGDPAKTLLDWGWDLDERRIARHARNAGQWQPAIPELVRMIFDQGLFNGWPAESESWAPYHALHMLGHLQAHEHTGRLLALREQENDWLSDRLPTVWAQMGPQTEPPLWNYLDDRKNDPDDRMIVLLGLKEIAEVHARHRVDIIAGLTRRLQRSSAADAEMNGYVVFTLNRMQATEAGDAIVEAFKQGKVDTNIMRLSDVSFLERLVS